MNAPRFSLGPVREHAACGVGLLAARDGVARHLHLERGLAALCAVEHRGALAADGRSSDGAGIMLDIPWRLLGHEPGTIALASLFLDPAYAQAELLTLLEQTFAMFDLTILDYREVPTRPGALGPIARETLPTMIHAIISRPRACRTEASFEARLYHAKQTARTRLRELPCARARAREPLFFTSLSARTVVYKALTDAKALPALYPDLLDHRFATRFALVHRRFSTNTKTSWDRAQPFRLVAHNGEINTIAGNRSWSYSREQALGLAPNELLSHRDVSDSGNLNEQVEALRVRSSIPQIEDILAITMPVAGVRNEFYSFWGRAMEPWDGPALVAWSDGHAAGARLDRNGFRPARWALSAELFVLGSEAGMFGLDAAEIERQGAIAAGSGVKVELDTGEVHFRDPSVSRENAGARFDARLFEFPALLPSPVAADPRSRAGLFGLDEEELGKVLRPMLTRGREAIGSMGDTARPALLSTVPRSLYDYMFQTFAQVTNPPLDYIRERSVTDLSTYLGKRPNIFAAKELLPQTPGLRLDTPVLSLAQMAHVRRLAGTSPRLRPREVDICIDAAALERGGGEALAAALDGIAEQTLDAAAHGCALVILSDRRASFERPPLPSLLALRAAVVALNREGLRLESALVLDTGEVRTTHQLACAIGFGATAVCPYLALELARHEQPETPEAAAAKLREALEAGLLKVMSKMGISVVRSYQSAKLFTCVGLAQPLLDRLFPGLRSPIGGLDLPELADELKRRMVAAEAAGGGLLPSAYLFKEDPRGRRGEAHAMTAAQAKRLHQVTGLAGSRKRGPKPLVAATLAHERWREFVEAAEASGPTSLRELLELRAIEAPIELSAVEERAPILARFGAGAMSFGAISSQAQRDIFVAMAAIGGRSNSGEGGQNPWYFVDGTHATTKQVASGRFGVDAEYLASADELEIKIAQGAKPGEGGQLMGVKVDAAIAAARHASPGVTLISPPPLHDIYSIEDLAQLIDELRAVNPRARIAVKLVSGVNIGTIAVGVAKAGADVIQISGGSGGTGAAPLSSMKHAGLAWELGLVEVHHALSAEGLRERVVLRVDGGLQRAFDILVAAALGAEEFGFGKLLLIAEGCIMARVCENNRCPRGIATHDPKFLAKYRGSPEAIVATLEHLADEVRAGLAQLGLSTLEALVGRSELLAPARAHRALIEARRLDLTGLLAGAPTGSAATRPEIRASNHERTSPLDRQILDDLLPRLEHHERVELDYAISSTDRAILGRLSGELAFRAHARRMAALARAPRTLDNPDRCSYLPAPGRALLRFHGSAGQGFACFLVQGVEVELYGVANDGVAKGMSGGVVTVRAPAEAGYVPEDNVALGNCALYGATGGALYVRGRAGDRFAVRNSGAAAVVEGVGMHACEYMTGGTVAILGSVGANLGAGMSGGRVYVRESEADRVNLGSVELRALDEHDASELRALVEATHARTGSTSAAALLADWERARASFRSVRARPAPSAEAEGLGSKVRASA